MDAFPHGDARAVFRARDGNQHVFRHGSEREGAVAGRDGGALEGAALGYGLNFDRGDWEPTLVDDAALEAAVTQIERDFCAQLRDAMSRAYTHAGQQAVTGFWQVSEALMPPRERERVAKLGSEG